MADCLHCAINELIDDHIKNGPQPIDLAELAAMIAQSLGEFILTAPQEHQAALMADCLATLGQTILERPDEGGRGKAH